MKNSLALNIMNPLSALRSGLSWRHFSNWEWIGARRCRASTRVMQKDSVTGVIAMPRIWNVLSRSRRLIRSVAANIARRHGRHSVPDTGFVTIIYANEFTGERNDNLGQPWRLRGSHRPRNGQAASGTIFPRAAFP